MNIEDLGSPLDTLSPKGKVITPDDVPYIKGEVVRADLAPDFESGEHFVGDFAWHDDGENEWRLYQCDEHYTGDFDPAKWHLTKLKDLFSESDTSTAANPDLNNKVLQGSVNVIVAAKTATVATSATAPTSVTLADNDCKTVTMGTATSLQIDFGAAKQTGGLRLCELVIADAPSTALTLSFPSGHTFHSSMATGKWYTTETGRNHFFFEETATNVWTVTRQVETSDTPTTTHTAGGAE